MKREDLKALGLSDEQIGSIMALHGQTVNELNGKLSSAQQEAQQYQSQLADNQKELETLKKSAKGNDELTSQLADLQAKFNSSKAESETKLADLKKQSAIDLALTTAGALNSKAAKALLDLDSLTLNDKGEVEGLTSAVETLQKDNAFLFKAQETNKQSSPQFLFGGNPNPDGGSGEKSIEEKIAERLSAK